MHLANDTKRKDYAEQEATVPYGNWGRVVLLAAVLAIVTLGSLEAFWRVHGHRPSVVDDDDLWATQREAIDASGQKTLAILGSSRSQIGVSTPFARTLLPDYNVVNLAMDGRGSAVAVLKDLAEDEHFTGVVLFDVTARYLFADQFERQQPQVSYFHEHFGLNRRLDRWLTSEVQTRLVVFNPQVGIRQLERNLVEKGHLPDPLYIITRHDRTKLADFTRADVPAVREHMVRLAKRSIDGAPNLSAEEWLQQALVKMEPLIKRIQSRGGDVVMVHFPVQGAILEGVDTRFPREKYWNAFSQHTRATTIHFQDVPGLSRYVLPDDSHLDYRNQNAFTKALLEELARRHTVTAPAQLLSVQP